MYKVGREIKYNYYLLWWGALKIFLPVAPALLPVQVNVSGGGKAVAKSLTTMEIKSISLGLTCMLVNKNICNW